MRHLFKPLFLLALVCAALPAPAATESAWAVKDEVQARLISGVSGVAGSELPLGLEIALAPGWKTYWRSPGAAGLPVSIDWEGSENLKSAALAWPAPLRFIQQDLDTFGYEGKVVLPIHATLENGANPAALKAHVSLMICKDVCIPYELDLALDLPVGGKMPSFHAGTLALWQSRVPGDGEIKILSAFFLNNQLTVTVAKGANLTAPDLMVEAEGAPLFNRPELQGETLVATPTVDSDVAALKPGTNITLTVVDGERASEKTLTLGALDSAPPRAIALVNLLSMLGAALLGGLILNLMPCVLPVLSLKLLTVVQHADAPPEHVRMSFLASAAGILVSFELLATLIIMLKQAGLAVGWGMQFQEPYFLIFMIALLGLFAATMWDFIHIPLPRFLADAINDRLPSPGQHDRTLVGNFITGMFATLLATPCSAPFVGTAIGFALGGSAISVVLIFTALGLGLATPYLLVAAFPRLARHMPRPGRWMGVLRAILGFALVGTALWLAYVLQAEWAEKASYVGGGLLSALFILWINHSIKHPRVLIKGIIAITLALAFAFNVPAWFAASPKERVNWQIFNEAAIPALVAEGKTVFVDVTADWCLTCKVNERLVLETPEIVKFLNSENVIAMRADWTRRDSFIAAYLKGFGRYGIPFNVFYGPKAPKGLALPELLSENAVRQTYEKVKP